MKPDENAAREYAAKKNQYGAQTEYAESHLSGQQHIIDTLAEMAREHEKAIIDASYKYSGELPSHRNCWSCCDTDSNHENDFEKGAHFGFTLGRASMQGEKEQWEKQWKDEVTANAAGYNEAHDKFQSQLTQRDTEIKRLNEMVEVMQEQNVIMENALRSIEEDGCDYSHDDIAGVAIKNITRLSELRKKL